MVLYENYNMQKFLRRILVKKTFLLLIIFCTLYVAGCDAQNQNVQIANLESQIKHLESEVDRLKDENEELRRQENVNGDG